MIPPLIVLSALQLGINLIAITDHNATDNIEAVQIAASGTGVTVLPGIELQTREDIHLLCLFDTLEQIRAFQKLVDDTLPNRANDPDFFGEQFVVDATGDFIRSELRLLLASTTLSLEQAIQNAHDLRGIAIPAHIDRQAYGLIPTLGFIPPNLEADAFEISRRMKPNEAKEKYPQLDTLPVIVGGDAHHPSELLGALEFDIETASIVEIKKALRNLENRKYSLVEVKSQSLQY